MKADKIEKFMALAGQQRANGFDPGEAGQRKLGALLLLSEVLEYVISGLGIVPEVNGVKITDANSLKYEASDERPDKKEMVDGLADVAYTMYWNACAFGVPLEEAFELVCDNNLEKFVKLSGWQAGCGRIAREEWSCGMDTGWPPEVVTVDVVRFKGEFYAVGKDASGKVGKPSSYRPVDLSGLY